MKFICISESYIMFLSDWFIRLKRSIINVLLELPVSESFSMSVTWNIL